jgi:hypothetical protein
MREIKEQLEVGWGVRVGGEREDPQSSGVARIDRGVQGLKGRGRGRANHERN